MLLQTAQESDEAALCSYLKHELAPTFERLGNLKALHEALRRVVHTLRSVSTAIREHDGQRSASMASAIISKIANKRVFVPLAESHATGPLSGRTV